jgi:hypothetical protein
MNELMTKFMSILYAIWDWVDDSPKHVMVFAVGCILAATFWKAILGIAFWIIVCPGSFALGYGMYRWWKKRQAS